MHCFPNYWNFGLERIKKKLSWRENLRELSRNGPDLIQYPDGEVSTSLVAWVLATIPDKTTWESFHHHVPFPTQQNYFQNDAFAEWKPLPPIRCCFLQTPRDQVFFWIHNNIAFRGTGEGRIGTATMFRKMLSKHTIFSTVLSKTVAGRSVNRASECFRWCCKKFFPGITRSWIFAWNVYFGKAHGKSSSRSVSKVSNF